MHLQKLPQDLVTEVVVVDRGFGRHAGARESIAHLQEPALRGIGAVAGCTTNGVQDGQA